MSMINPPKWRGIKTTPIPKYEDEAVTIKNYLGQKSFSLPRIDDGKRWAGFPGLAGTAKKIAKLVPPCEFFVEPFAGAGRVFQELRKLDEYWEINYILNEKSDFINKWLKREFGKEAQITKMDFARCIKRYDSENTVFLIDYPWVKSYYNQSFSTFDRESVIAYEEEILEICKTIKGKFIITSRVERVRMRNSGYHGKIIRSVYKVSGKLPEVLLTSNFDLRRKK